MHVHVCVCVSMEHHAPSHVAMLCRTTITEVEFHRRADAVLEDLYDQFDAIIEDDTTLEQATAALSV